MSEKRHINRVKQLPDQHIVLMEFQRTSTHSLSTMRTMAVMDINTVKLRSNLLDCGIVYTMRNYQTAPKKVQTCLTNYYVILNLFQFFFATRQQT